MRLTQKEREALVSTLANFVNHHSAELRLFGSRVDDCRKGGDIDLLLIVSSADLKHSLKQEKHIILSRLYELLGEQKIDLIIALPQELGEDPFLEIIYPASILLKSWGEKKIFHA